ncbi:MULTISPECIES: primosomal protein DnaT [unclassified Pantoea]|uniref:primosomal protein DnaT n=1 Tax=unclassified Pantoea TaxID=2630326 RepID=UPI0023DB9054|nr:MULTISPECIES: primosomal protein DnaT [unclassified Pantoea]MDF2042707.1 primosomal protein DnaT [Pantoea sp. Cr_R14]MDF2068938.1 primosomal protein DnaT [Pantoea sp. Cr_R13]MDF2079675.1 primosomal protein DnaT [Pantoea sp. Cr_R21]
MSAKILTSTLIGLDAFRQDPLTALQQAEKGTLAVLDNYAPVMYAITPTRLAELLALEAAARQPNDVALDDSLYDDAPAAIHTPAGKFAMYQGWQPDADFTRQAAIWGVALSEPVTPSELAAFVAYWQAEGRMFHHVQWQQKLARSIQMNRAANGGQPKRDITQLPDPDRTIPDGFRGE